jgi:hypothetical protein
LKVESFSNFLMAPSNGFFATRAGILSRPPGSASPVHEGFNFNSERQDVPDSRSVRDSIRMKVDLLSVRHLANDEIVAGFQKALGVSDLPETLTTYISGPAASSGGSLHPQFEDQILRHIAEKIGSSPSGIKQVGGWLLEKAARFETGPHRFQELRVVPVDGAARGWRPGQAFPLESPANGLGPGCSSRMIWFESLIWRAQKRYDEVESQRLKLAQSVLSPAALNLVLVSR